MSVTAVARWSLLVVLLWEVSALASETAAPAAVELRRFDAPEATQAVAVDNAHFYAIGDNVVAKYAKDTGTLCQRWTAPVSSCVMANRS